MFVDHVCRLYGGVPLFVATDFDKSGLEICQRLTTVSDYMRENDLVKAAEVPVSLRDDLTEAMKDTDSPDAWDKVLYDMVAQGELNPENPGQGMDGEGI